MKPAIIIGGGGHAKVLASTLLALDHPILGFTDPDESRDLMLGVPRIGSDGIISSHDPSAVVLVNGIGCVEPGPLRATIFRRFKDLGYSFLTVIHPAASVAKDAVIGEGTAIFAGAVVQTAVTIGANAILNTRASVDHDCEIGSHVHIAPGVTLSGAVTVGDGTHLGVGCTVIQGVTIGTEALVGAGSVVLREVKAGARVFGNPARPIPGSQT
jgi:sugar O-acyltransferase (sialic acid O-acetyltransferase NeuD family)